MKDYIFSFALLAMILLGYTTLVLTQTKPGHHGQLQEAPMASVIEQEASR